MASFNVIQIHLKLRLLIYPQTLLRLLFSTIIILLLAYLHQANVI